VANTPSTSNHRIGGTLADRLKRLQGAGIQADYGRPTQIPLMGNRGMPRSRGPIPGPSSSQRPPTSPPDGVQTISPTVDLPITTTITPQRLNSLLETRGLNILLLDVRNRNEFERERINHDAIVCLEPVSLTRPG
jgi:ubiquitin carboxyl-terminal hydrolase 8